METINILFKNIIIAVLIAFPVLVFANSNNSPSSETNDKPQRGDTRVVVCSDCNASGLVFYNSQFHSKNGGYLHQNECSLCQTDHLKGYCNACRRTHCLVNNKHNNCKVCDGKTTVKETFNGFSWSKE